VLAFALLFRTIYASAYVEPIFLGMLSYILRCWEWCLSWIPWFRYRRVSIEPEDSIPVSDEEAAYTLVR
jgi:hypothetical protein